MRKFNKFLTIAFIGVGALAAAAVPLATKAENNFAVTTSVFMSDAATEETGKAGETVESAEDEATVIGDEATGENAATGETGKTGETVESAEDEATVTGEIEATEVEEAVYEAETVIYDGSTFDTYKDRSRETVADAYVTAFYDTGDYNDRDSNSYYASRPKLEEPIATGTLDRVTHTTVNNVIGYYRWLTGVGVPKVKSTASNVYAPILQKQALVRNFDFSDTIDTSKLPSMEQGSKIKPEGLAKDYTLKNQGGSPIEAIETWVTGTDSSSDAGDRYTILSPNLYSMEFAYTGNVALLRTTESSTANSLGEAFVSFPAPGPNPTQILDDTNSSWTVYIDSKILSKATGTVVVKIKNTRKGTTMTRKSESSDVVYENLSSNIGVLTFRGPKDTNWNEDYHDIYDIEITGFIDNATGNAAVIKYQVDIFDAFEESSMYVVESASGENIEELSIFGDAAELTEKNINTAVRLIPSNIVAKDGQGNSVTFSVDDIWQYDSKSGSLSISARKGEIPDDWLDPYKILANATIEVNFPSPAYYSSSFYPSAAKVGGNVKLTAAHYPYDDRTKFVADVYKYDESTSKFKLMYSDKSPLFYQVSPGGNNDYYDLKNLQKSDSGLYVYYTKNNNSVYGYITVDYFEVKDTADIIKIYPFVSNFYVYNGASDDYKKLAAKCMPHEAYVVTDTGELIKVETTGAWTYDAANEEYTNYIEKSSLPSHVNDPSNLLSGKLVIAGNELGSLDNYYRVMVSSTTPRYGKKLDVYHEVEKNSLGYSYQYDVAKYNPDTEETKFYNSSSSEVNLSTTTDDEIHYTFENIDDSVNGEYYLIRKYLTAQETNNTYDGYYDYNFSSSFAQIMSKPTVVTAKDNANVISATFHKYVYTSNSDTTNGYLKRVGYMLPHYVFFKTDTGEEFKIESDGAWTLSSSGGTWNNTCKKGYELPEGVVEKDRPLVIYVTNNTKIGALSGYSLTCNYERLVEPGASITFTMTNTSKNQECKDVRLYKFVENNNGDYTASGCTLVYDSAVSGDADLFERTGKYTYTIENASAADNGDYMSIWYKKDGGSDTCLYAPADNFDIEVDHTYVTIPGERATCTASGTTDGKKCSVCNTVFIEQQLEPAKGHTSVDMKPVPPTCVTPGKIGGKYCSTCNMILEPAEETGLAYHEFEERVSDKALKSPATTESPAYYYYTCKTCGIINDADDAETFSNGEKLASKVDVYYTTHVQTYGWQGDPDVNKYKTWKKNGEMSGTSGQAKRLEGIEIKLDTNADLGIEYRTHIQTYGWEKTYKADGAMSGTKGEAKRLEAISIRLTGADKDRYDVYYRVHAQTYGWLGWAKNGENAGTAAQAKRLEGIEILVLPKGEVPSTGTVGYSYIELGTRSTNGPSDGMVNYMTHVQSYGNQKYVYDGSISGAVGEGKRIEGLRINLNNEKIGYEGDIVYQTQVQTYGWLSWSKNGEFNGTSGQAKRVEAIRIKLTGEVAEHYDVYYRIYSEGYGWLGWAKNGEDAGTVGLAKRLEGLQVVLVPKGQATPSHLPGSASAKPCVTK